MRIAIYSDNFYPELSGITDSIMTIAAALRDRGHRIAFYVPHYSRGNYRFMNRPRDVDLGENISVFRLPALPYKTGTGQGRAVLPVGSSFFSVRRFDPDIIHFHIFAGAGLEAIMMAKILGKPLVGTNHTPILEFIHYSPVQTEWFKRLAMRYDSWVYNHCDFVASPAQAIFDHMRYFKDAIPHRVVSNPIRTARFVPPRSKDDAKKMAGLPHFTVLSVNKLSVEKNLHLVMRAVARVKPKIPDITFAMAGQGSYEKELRDLARGLGLEKNVRFLGFVPLERLPLLYQASDAAVVMSNAETQSISLMQALACGVPALASDAWGLHEYIVDGVGFRIPPGNVEALAEKILYLYAHPRERARMGKAGRAYVEQFSIDRITRIWEEIYETAIMRYTEKA